MLLACYALWLDTILASKTVCCIPAYPEEADNLCSRVRALVSIWSDGLPATMGVVGLQRSVGLINVYILNALNGF